MYRVLIVDDDKVIRQDIKNIFEWEKHGFRIIAEADNGAVALELIAMYDINLVITDIYMPVMDGVELIKKVKSANPHIEFVVISNYDEFKFVREAMRYGAYDYLLKYEIDAESFLPIINAAKRLLDKQQDYGDSNTGEMDDKWKHVVEETFWKNVLTGQFEANNILSEAAKLKLNLNSAPHIIILLDANSIDMDKQTFEKAVRAINQCLPAYVHEFSEEFKYDFVLQVEESMWVIVLKTAEKSQGVIKNSSFYFSKEIIKQIKRNFNIGL